MAKRLFPAVAAERARRYQIEFRQQIGLTSLAHRFAAQHGTTVLYGPFRGLRYSSRLDEVDVPITKLLGCYEQELHEAFGQALAAQTAVFVDIGCAEGYYAVGFALRSPQTTVYAYEAAGGARAAAGSLARLNDVAERVHLRGRCRPTALASLPLDGALLLCDIEGGERDLFTPRVAAALARTTLLIELHEFVHTEIAVGLLDRFATTHEHQLIRPRERDPGAFSELVGFTPEEQRLALDELRIEGGLSWIWLRPRNDGFSRS